MLQEPCSTPLIRPRERVGQDSIASAAPAGQFRAHADAEQRAEQVNSSAKFRRNAGEQVADRVPQDRDHQRRLAPDAVGEPAASDGADQSQPEV